MASKRILLISRCPPYPLHLGDRLIIWHLARELSARGYTFDLCALTQSPADADDIPEYASFFDTIHLFPERQRTPLMYLQRLLGRHYPRQAKQAWQPELWHTVETLLSENDYDAIHLFGGVHVYELAYLLKDQPTVITPYESFSLYLDREWQQHQQITTLLNRTIARQFESWMFTPYDITTVLTEQDADVLASLDKQLTLEVIPNGIDLADFETSD
ncbi:MAG: glycosyltransferase, partial [Chloroflexota bacterium]